MHMATKGCFVKQMCQEPAGPTFLLVFAGNCGRARMPAQEDTPSLCQKTLLSMKIEDSSPLPPALPRVIYQGVVRSCLLYPFPAGMIRLKQVAISL